MFWSLVRPDRILPPITRSAAVPTSLDADESAGIVQLPGNAPQAAPGQSRGLPRGAGDRRKFSRRRTRARRRLENVTQEPPGSRVGTRGLVFLAALSLFCATGAMTGACSFAPSAL